MSQYQRRGTKKRKKQKEATIVGDLFRILFAVSMLVVAILFAFFVMKNLTGFSLPDLKQTVANETEAPMTVRVEETTSTAATTAEATRTLETEEEMTRLEETETASEREDETAEETIEEETVESQVQEAEDPSNAEEIVISETKPEPSGGHIGSIDAEIGEAPVEAATDVISEQGPGQEVHIGDSPVGPGGA